MTGSTNGGNMVTAGDVVFQGVGTGDFYAFDAQTGAQLFKYTAESGIRASPGSYAVDGQQYVTVIAANTVLAFGLP